MEEKGLCPSRKHLQGGEVVGSASLSSSTPRAKGKEDGGEARTMHAEYAGQRVLGGRLRNEGTGDTWT